MSGQARGAATGGSGRFGLWIRDTARQLGHRALRTLLQRAAASALVQRALRGLARGDRGLVMQMRQRAPAQVTSDHAAFNGSHSEQLELSTVQSGGCRAAGIFVSHARADDALCHPLVAHLRMALLCAGAIGDPAQDCQAYCDEISYYDPTAAHLNATWQQRHEHELAARPVFVVVVSGRAGQDTAVRAQTERALQLCRNEARRSVIPMLVERSDPDALHPGLAAHRPIDVARQGYDAAFAELLARLAQACARATESEGGVSVAISGERSGHDGEDGKRPDGVSTDGCGAEDARPRAQALPAADKGVAAVAALDCARALTPLDAFTERRKLLAGHYEAERAGRLTAVLAQLRPRGHPGSSASRIDLLFRELDVLTQLGSMDGAMDEAYALAREVCAQPTATVAERIAYVRLSRVVEACMEVPRVASLVLRIRLAGGEQREIAFGTMYVLPHQRQPLALAFPDDAREQAEPRVATYNAPLALFEQQIESLRAQTLRSWICIICDDCSDAAIYRSIQQIVVRNTHFCLRRTKSGRTSTISSRATWSWCRSEQRLSRCATRTTCDAREAARLSRAVRVGRNACLFRYAYRLCVSSHETER